MAWCKRKKSRENNKRRRSALVGILDGWNIGI
jgi:hypothetical protein